ncbi:MAG TPA: GNAT family N-acetyltransferase [Verrucomicrobiae bacterium]|nr:GNAT family N-acetyltransferase [Verrucomicrobiae bacterium]
MTPFKIDAVRVSGIHIQHNSKRQRFETHLDGRLAYLSYTFRGNLVLFDHAYVPEEFRGKGVAAALVREGRAEARRQRWKVVPDCSYVEASIERHPEFADLMG